MPFEQHIPRPFTPISVRTFAPAASGVYGISNAREWIYIGVAEDIQAALLGHLSESDTSLTQRRPTGFVFEVCAATLRATRQDRLLLEYEPVCNRRSSQRR
jgi:hypothetical protein